MKPIRVVKKRKKKLRLRKALAVVVAIVAIGGIAFGLRSWQLSARAKTNRAEGMAALAAGDFLLATRDIGAYLHRFPADSDALCAYAQAREHVEEEDGRHLTESITAYRHSIGINPDNAVAAKSLLGLYRQLGYDSELLNLSDSLLQRKTLEDDAWANRAWALARLQRYKEALDAANGYCGAHPADIDAQCLRFQMMLRCGMSQQDVLNLAKTLLLSHADNASFETLTSLAESLAGETSPALALAKSAAGRRQVDPSTTLLLVTQLDALNAFEESTKLLNRCANGELQDVRFERAFDARLIEMQQNQELVDRLTPVPADNQLRGLRGLALLRLGRKEETAKACDELDRVQYNLTATAWSRVLRLILSSTPDDGALINGAMASLKACPTEPFFANLLGDAYEAIGEHEYAVYYWQQAAHLSPAWADPMVRMSRAAAAAGQLDQAVALADGAAMRLPDDVETHVASAQAHAAVFAASDGKDASSLFAMLDRIDAMAPEDSRSKAIRASLIARTDPPQAATYIQSIIANSEKPPEADLLLQFAAISARYHLGVESDCLTACERLHTPSPNLALAKARLAYDAGKTKEAIAIADQISQPAVEWQSARAMILEMTGDSRAAETWRQLAENNARNARAQWEALSAHSARGNRQFVIATLDRLRSCMGEKNLAWRLAKAEYLLENGHENKDLVDASLLLDDVTKAEPAALSPRLLLAECFERDGNLSGAIEQLIIAGEIDPASVPIALEAARLLELQGDFEQAHLQLSRATNNPAATAEQRHYAAALLADQGDAAGALTALQQLYGPNATPSDLLMAELYYQRRQPDQAAAICQKLLQHPTAASIDFATSFYLARGQLSDAESALKLLDPLSEPQAEKEYVRGNFAFRRRDFPTAIRFLSSATAQNPNDLRAWQQLIRAAVEAGNLTGAVQMARQAAVANPSTAGFDAFARLASTFPKTVLQNGMVADGLLWLLTNPQDFDPVAGVLSALTTGAVAAIDRPEHARWSVRAAADARPQCLPLQTLAVDQSMNAGEYEDAIQIATRAVQTFPKTTLPARQLTMALAGANRWPEVVDAATKWRDRNPEDVADADGWLVSAYIRLGNPAAGKKQLDADMAFVAPGSAERSKLVYKLAECASASGDYAGARSQIEPMLGSDPGARAEWIREAAIQLPVADAFDWLNHVAPIIPKDDVDGLVSVGLAWQQVALRADEPASRNQARNMTQKAFERAALSCEAIEKPSPTALMNLGMSYEAIDPARAEKFYRLSLRLGDLPVVYNNLAMMLADQNRELKEAEQLALHAVKSNSPQTADFYDTLAFVQTRQRNYDGAITSLQNALRLRPDQVNWQVHLAQLYVQVGKTSESKSWISKLQSVQVDDPRLDATAREQLQRLRQTSNGKALDN